MYITTPAGTKRIVEGNVFEGKTGCDGYTREWVKAHDHSGDLYDPGIGSIVSGMEKWDLPNTAIFWLIDLSGEVSYLSAELADGSWVVGAYVGWEEQSYTRKLPCLRMANADDFVKKVNSAEVVPQSEADGYVDVKVNVSKDASKICFVNSRGSSITYTPDNTAVKSIEHSGGNDIWTITLKVYRPTDTYTVRAKYGREWTPTGDISFTVTAL